MTLTVVLLDDADVSCVSPASGLYPLSTMLPWPEVYSDLPGLTIPPLDWWSALTYLTLFNIVQHLGELLSPFVGKLQFGSFLPSVWSDVRRPLEAQY